MPDDLISVDEFLGSRKAFVKGDVLCKAARGVPSWDKDKRSARFVMSAEVEDRDRDIVVQAGLNTDGFAANPVALWAHSGRSFPVGTWTDIEKVLGGRPKRTEGTLKLVSEGGDEIADRLAFHLGEGTVRACSIGFIPKAVRKRDVPEDKKTESYYYPGYLIEEAELVECSAVAIPANPAALAKAAVDGDVVASDIIEMVLDTWAKHPETGLLVPRAEFEAAHRVATGERTGVTVPSASDASGDASPPPTLERSLIRRALDYVLGGGDAPEAVVSIQQLSEERLRQQRIADLEAAHKRIMRRAALSERKAGLSARLEAKGLT